MALASFAASSIFVKLLKGTFARPRPIAVLLDARVLVESGAGYSFPSGHATLAFAVAFVFAAKYPKFRYPLFALAALVALSRIYIGMHFPSDVLAGAALGSAVGLAVTSIERIVSKKA